MFGTPAFMAPEQALGKTDEIDALSDLWAVGATAFLLLTGRLVHQAATSDETLVLSATQPAPAIGSLVHDVPPIIASGRRPRAGVRQGRPLAERAGDARCAHLREPSRLGV